MARSSIFRTPALQQVLSAAAEFIDECCAIVPRGRFPHVERRNDPVIRVSVDHVLNDGVMRLGLVNEARRDVSQNISHIVAALPILVIAEPAANEDLSNTILE